MNVKPYEYRDLSPMPQNGHAVASPMPQNEYTAPQKFCEHYAYWDYSEGKKKCTFCNRRGILAEIAEQISNKD